MSEREKWWLLRLCMVLFLLASMYASWRYVLHVSEEGMKQSPFYVGKE